MLFSKNSTAVVSFSFTSAVLVSVAALAVTSVAVPADAAPVVGTITPFSGDPLAGTAAGAPGVSSLQDGLVGAGVPGSYVTNAPGGFPSDYIAVGTPVVLDYDFGGTTPLSGFLGGLYAGGHPNSATQFSIDLGTILGASDVAAGIVVNLDINGANGQLVDLGGTFNAAFARVTVTDNGFVPPGTNPAGGDRVGFSEAAFDFEPVPEPASLAIAALGLLGIGFVGWRRRRR